MTKEIRFTTADLNIIPETNDCVLPPDDPAYALIHGEQAKEMPVIKTNNKAQIQREQNIQPGTPEWFRLWFGDKNAN